MCDGLKIQRTQFHLTEEEQTIAESCSEKEFDACTQEEKTVRVKLFIQTWEAIAEQAGPGGFFKITEEQAWRYLSGESFSQVFGEKPSIC